jgi:hypothetical protein
MPYRPLRRHLAAALVAGLLLLVTGAAAAARPALSSGMTGSAATVASEEPAPGPPEERPDRGLTGLLAVVATVCVLGVTAAAIRTIYAQRSRGTMNS